VTLLDPDPTYQGDSPSLPSSYFLAPSLQFPLSSAGRVNDCSETGYRKVFIDFKPKNPSNPSQGFDINVDMLVNTGGVGPQLVQVLNTEFIPDSSQPVPETFKIGFAGATGAEQAYQEIRNVTVQVSNEDQLNKPVTSALNASACIGEEEFFELDVNLQNINSQIQCIQLYKTEAEALAVQNQLDQITNVQNCESGICQIEVCKQERLVESTNLGEFEAFIFLENINGADIEVPRIKFTSSAGAAGTTTIWYTVTDNFGQISEPKPINIIINPYPYIDGSASIIGPTCDGQNDGSISNVILKDLVPGFDYEWRELDTNGNIISVIPTSNYTQTVTQDGNYLQANVGVTGLNLGNYELAVRNPATNSPCDYVFGPFSLLDERGTPVVVVIDDQEICEGSPVEFIPELEDPTDANNPTFLWWKDNNKTQLITDGLVEGGVMYSLVSPGELTITGLPQNTTPYEFFVEVAADPSQNLCATPAGQLKRVQVLVLSPLTINADVIDDLCREGEGQIVVNPSGGFGTYQYSLDGGPFQPSNTFSGLIPGVYTIDVQAGSNCIGTITREVIGAPELFLIEEELIQPACGEENGLIEVSFSGGTPGYTLDLLKNGSLISTTNSPSLPTIFQDLAPGDYQIMITDSNGCTKVLNRVLVDDIGIPISIDPMTDEICAGDVATILPVITTAGNPELTWYKDPNQQNPISSNATPDADGLVFTVDANNLELTVTGLQPGTYTYYLVAEGPGYCPNPPFEANITVLEPITATLAIENEACFEAGDGSIEVSASGSDGNFEYSINGGADWQSTTLFTNLSPGTYTIDIRSTGGNDCVFSVSGEVLGTTPIAINAPDILRSSCGLSNGSIENLQISGGWGNYAVEWRQGSETGPVISTDPTQAIDLSPDTYFLLITDAEGCLFVESFVLEEQPRPNFEIAPVEICAGEEVILTPVNTVSGSSGSELVWYKDASRTQEISNGPDAIDPSVSYSIDANGILTIKGLAGDSDPYTYYLHVVCNDENVSVEALVRNVPAPVFETDSEQCFGAEDGKIRIIAGADPLYKYSISGNNLTQSELEAAEYAPGTYTISVSNEGFCLQEFTVVVEGPDAPLEVDPLTRIDPNCGEDIGIITTEVSGGWAPYEVTLFRDGSAIETSTFQGPEVEFDDLAPGDYYLTVTDAEGCVEISNTVTLEYGPTQIIIDDVVICEGEDAVLIPSINPSAPNPIYSWFKDAAATIPIVSDPNPDANGHIFQIAANGTLTISGLDASDSPHTYYATVSGTDICEGFIGSAQVVINRIPSLSYAISNEVCFGDNGTINLQGSAGDGTFEYSLNGNDWQDSGTFDVAPGIYTGYVRSGTGCVVSSPNIEVQGPSAPLSYSESALVDPTCNTADGSISFAISGGYGNYTVEVTKDGASFGTFASPSGQVDLQNLESGSYSFLILDENPDGINCQLSIPAQIELEDIPTPLSASDVEICEGETASIQASTTQTGITPIFTWYENSNGSGQISSGTSGGLTYQVNASTGELSISGLSGRTEPYIYYVGVSGAGVCEPDLIPVEVRVFGIPNLRVSNPSIVCDPQGTVDLTQFIEGFNPNLYDYNIVDPKGGAMRLEDIDEVNITGSYRVSSSIKGSSCWSPEQRIQVIISDTELVPEFNYEVDLGGGNVLTNGEVQIQEPVDFQDESLGKIIIWNWDFGDGTTSSEQNPTHKYQKKGSYTVTLTTIDEFGCVAEYQRVIQVFDDYIIMVPNAFTPDGTKNQYFKPRYRGIASMEFYIFNTWGELIFEANSLETMGWDGTLNGKKVPNGNYVYRGRFVSRGGVVVEKSGVFILIR
ncbi:MAG: PKD domain-containing protein, partial [Flavobacteriaceae bacterium]|nr:PKD domain-containing protein [Flavobacteriaceae bacterium]